MKFNAKQIEDLARLLGTLSAAAVSGATIGWARPDQVTPREATLLIGAFVMLLTCMVVLRRE
jgi:hypothetical protein